MKTTVLGISFLVVMLRLSSVSSPLRRPSPKSNGPSMIRTGRCRLFSIPARPDRRVVPPPGAVVLFDGKDLSPWTDAKGNPARWKVENGYMEVAAGTGSIQTKQGFGDCQLHVEWASPGRGERRRAGARQQRRVPDELYEVQVLDGYDNKTYADGIDGRHLRPVPADVQRLPEAGRMADATISSSMRRVSTRTRSCSRRPG